MDRSVQYPIRSLGWVLAAAVCARVVTLWAIGNIPVLHGDELYYVARGRTLAEHGTYRGAFRPPGQSAFIAAVFHFVGGPSLLAARLGQVLVSLVGVALAFDLARTRFGDRAAGIAGGLCALHPTLVNYTHFLWAENQYAVLLLTVVWCLLRFSDSGGRVWIVAAAIALGLAALTRETALYFVPLALVWLAVVAQVFPIPGLQTTRLFLATATIVVLPWMVRNYVEYGSFTVSTNRWRPIALGNTTGADYARIRHRVSPEDVTHPRGDVAREAEARAMALRSIWAQQPWWLFHKMRTATTTLLGGRSQLARFVKKRWVPQGTGSLGRWLVSVETWVGLSVMVLGMLGMWFTPMDRLKALVLAMIGYHWAIYVVSWANPRFVVPFIPMVAIYAGALLARAPSVSRRGSLVRIGAATTVGLYLLVAL